MDRNKLSFDGLSGFGQHEYETHRMDSEGKTTFAMGQSYMALTNAKGDFYFGSRVMEACRAHGMAVEAHLRAARALGKDVDLRFSVNHMARAEEHNRMMEFHRSQID